MKRLILPALGLAAAAVSFSSCSNNSDSNASTNSSISGKVNSLSVSSMSSDVHQMTTKTITHVMAVSPSTSSPARYVSAVKSDGSFSLGLNSGKPYIFVFVSQDGTLTGPDMIVGIVKVSSNDLDTLPIAAPADVALGDVSVSGTTGLATISTTVADLNTKLGITADEATYIGSIDDLALRLANPDVDNNGVIDATENKNFGMDWHVRANTKINGSDMVMNDINNQFADPSQLTLVWTLSSAYAVYPKSFDDVDYIVSSGTSTSLQNGGAFAYTGTLVAHTSVSGGTFSNMRQWGPDYDMTSQEMGGSDSAATFTYTLGSASKVLKYSNVRTKTRAQLSAEGVMLPFVKLNTTGGKLTGIDYKWMKRSGSTWAQATAAEVGLLVQDQGAYLNLYTQKGNGVENGISFTIPSTSATGTINIGASGSMVTNVANPTNLTLNDICSSALSYDDKMGLRIFAGAPMANATQCN